MKGRRVGAAVSVEAAAPLATRPDDGLSAFLCARPRLFGIAYRMVGSAAEDIVQDVWVRWQTTDRSRVRNPLAFLVAVTRRLAINVLHSARARREICSDSRLPELVDTAPDPGLAAERDEALSAAVLLLLEKLLPTERAAYLHREAFNYPYREIADVLQIEEANARQIVTRAREHAAGERRASVSPALQRRLLNAFVAAASTGDLAGLENLFALDLVSTSEDWCARCAPAGCRSRELREPRRRHRATLLEWRDRRFIETNGQLGAEPAPKDAWCSRPLRSLNRLDPPSIRRGNTTNLNSVERSTIERVMRDMDGNIAKAARTLGISRSELYVRLRKYGFSQAAI